MPESEIEKAIKDQMLLYAKEPQRVLDALRLPPGTMKEQVEERLREVLEKDRRICQLWRNDRYQVAVYANDTPEPGWPRMVHLSIKRNDRQPIHDWRDLQEIKNQLVGTEHEAVELYQAESRRVDSANQYHLFVLAQEGIKFPFGFNDRFVVDPVAGSVSQQRAFEKEAV